MNVGDICPVSGCLLRVVGTMLMCRAHWAMVAPALQRNVYYFFKRSPGKPMHLKAMRAAIESVDKRVNRKQGA